MFERIEKELVIGVKSKACRNQTISFECYDV
jgi:hypothetical protein